MNPLAIIAMKDKLKGIKPSVSSNTASSTFSANNNNVNSNLDKSHDKLIIDIIQGEKKVVENKPKNTIISLEEAANRIKNSR